MTTLERTLRITRDGPVMILTLSRPEARNALDTALLTRLAAGLRLAAEDPTVRAIILTGTNDVFATSPHVPAESEVALLVLRRLRESAKPVIAVINGAATELGLDLALACDIRIAAASALIGDERTAPEALAKGLVDRVIPPADLLPVAREVARQLAVSWRSHERSSDK